MADFELGVKEKEFLKKRLGSHERIEKAAQIIEVIQAMSSLSGDPDKEARSIINGSSEAKVSFVVDVVGAYRKEKSSKPIKDFFNEKYKDKALVLAKPADAIQEAIRSYDAGGPSKPGS